MPDELQQAVAIPPLTAHVWYWFVELCGERSRGMEGESRLTSRNILDWQALTGTRIESWELRAIRRLDAAWMESKSTNQE